MTDREKRALKSAARAAGRDLSSYVLGKALPTDASRFTELVSLLAAGKRASAALAELNDLLIDLPGAAVPELPDSGIRGLDQWSANYVAAMVELAAHRRGVPAPNWTREVRPLSAPWFASSLMSLREHLLLVSPPPFRARNLFIDSTLGDRV